MVDPPYLFAEGGGDRAVRSDRHLVAEGDVGDEQSEEVEGGQELVVAAWGCSLVPW
jgi:hypothetical protein